MSLSDVLARWRSTTGVNIPGRCEVPVDQVDLEMDAGHVRFVDYPDADAAALRAYAEELWRRRIGMIVVLARESIAGYSDERGGVLENAYQVHTAIQRVVARYDGLPMVLQVGNEPDGGGLASWTLSPRELGYLLDLASAAVNGAVPIITAGLCSGNPDYLATIQSWLRYADAIAVHPYLQRPDDASWPAPDWGYGYLPDLVQGYARYGKPLMFTEWGCFASEPCQAEYVERFLKACAQQPSVKATTYFAAHDFDGFGLYEGQRAEGPQRAAAVIFARYAARAMGQRDAARLDEEPRYVLGFERFARTAPELVGAPLENERELAPGLRGQTTENGLLLWVAQGDALLFVRGDDSETYRLRDGALEVV